MDPVKMTYTEVAALVVMAQRIFLHEMTETERQLVHDVDLSNKADLPPAMLKGLINLVKTKGHLRSAS
jgi:hypothetical protein